MTEINKSDKRLCRHDSSESITNKCGSWTLDNNEQSNPMLEAMGLSFLPEKEDSTSSSSSSFAEMTINGRVLQPLTDNVNQSVLQYHSDYVNEDFFVFKRRRLNSVRGEDKINNLHDEHLLHIFQFLPKYMLARCAQVCRRWKRICFDESLWRSLDLAGKTLKPGVVGRLLIRGSKILRLSKAEISSPAFYPQLQHIQQNIDIQSKLTHLDLSMAAIEVSALEEILSVCSQLQKVSLELCTVSKKVCEYISKNHYLVNLNMAMSYNVESEGLYCIFQGCPKLQVLNIAWAHLTDQDLTIICSTLPCKLTRLNISGCRNTLVDKHIILITKRCPRLIELDVSDSMKLSGDSVSVVMCNLPNIELLAFSRCYGISPKLYLDLKNLTSLSHLDVFGIFNDSDLSTVKGALSMISVNKRMFSSVARPTVGIRRTSIWGERVRDRYS